MKSKIWIVAILFVIGIIAAIAIARSSQGGPGGAWDASGFIEADIVSIAPEIAGRVTARPVSESDQVKQGDVLLKIEDDILSAEVDLARGRLAEAQAVLAQAQAGTRQETIAKAEAQLKLAQAGREANSTIATRMAEMQTMQKYIVVLKTFMPVAINFQYLSKQT